MLKNRSKVTVKGLNQERAINNIIKKIKVYNFKRESHDTSHFEVEYKDRKKAKQLLKENRLEILSFSNNGFFAFLKRLCSSFGVIIGLVISILGYIVQYNFIFQIKAYGQSNIENRQIERYIEGNLKSRFKGDIDTKQLEAKVRNQFDEITSVSISIVGQSLIVNLNEVDIPEEMQEEFQPLLSEYDGRITQINLVQGTAAVNEGDIVKKGDILVYPYIIDAEGTERKVCAKAEIMADVWLEGKQTHYDCHLKTERTGQKIVLNEVYLGSLKIYSKTKINTFSEWEEEFYWQDLSKNNILPFKLKKIIYYETRTAEVKSEFSSVEEEVKQNACEKALIFLQENEIIKEENFVIKEGVGWHEVRHIITVNRNIGG